MTFPHAPAPRRGAAALGRNILEALTSRETMTPPSPAPLLFLPYGVAVLLTLTGGAA